MKHFKKFLGTKMIAGSLGALGAAAFIAFITSFVGMLIVGVWVFIQNYEYCDIPFQQECWRPDNVYYSDPIRDQEILSMAKHMEKTRKSLEDKEVNDFNTYIEDLPVYDSQDIDKVDSEKYFRNGKCKPEAADCVSEGNSGGETSSNSEKNKDDKTEKESASKSNSSDSTSNESSTGFYQITSQPEDNASLRDNLKKVLGKEHVNKTTGKSNKFRENLDSYVDTIIEAGKTEGIDPRFIVAITVHETGYGTSGIVHNHNNSGGITCVNKAGFNIKGCSGGWTVFGSLNDSLRYKANLLKRLYADEGRLTVPQVGAKYAPIGAANDPNNLNANWVPNIGMWLKSMGVAEDIGVNLPGVIGAGSSGAPKPDLKKYKQMKVYRVKIGEDSEGEAIYQNKSIKKLTSDLKKQMKSWFPFTSDDLWAAVFKEPVDATMSEAELHLRSLIQMDLDGTAGMDRLKYETAHALLRAGRGLGTIKSGDSKPGNSGGASTISDPGVTGTPTGEVLYMESTAYVPMCGAGCSGITALGIDARVKPTPKVIAVDPKVIPLGTYVHVEGYGEAIAGDTGGAIKGNIIDVLVPDLPTAYSWGRKHNVKVTILNGKPSGFDSPLDIDVSGGGHDASGDAGFAHINLSDHKKEFVKWLKDVGFDKEVTYKNDDELIRNLLLTGDYVNEKNILLEAATDELIYPFLVVELQDLPTDEDGDKIKEAFKKLMKDEKLSEQMLSTLTIGHYLKRNAFEEFKKDYQDDLGIFSFQKENVTVFFEKYVKEEKAKTEEENFKNETNKKYKNMSFMGKIKKQAQGLWMAPNKLMVGTYMDMKVKGDTFIRFAIYTDTGDLMEMGAYARSMCFYTEKYGNEKFAESDWKQKLDAWGNKIGETVGNLIPGDWVKDEVGITPTDDFCIRVNKMAYGDGKMEWFSSQVVDKVKAGYNFNFTCEQLPESVLNQRRQEAIAAIEAQKKLEEEAAAAKNGSSVGSGEGSGSYDDQIDKLFPEAKPTSMSNLKLYETATGTAVAGEFGEFTGDGLKPRSPYNHAKTTDYPDLLDKIRGDYSESKAEKIYNQVVKVYNSGGGSGIIGLNKEGVQVGQVQKVGDAYSIEWINFDDNSKNNLTINGPVDCSSYKDPEYGFETHKQAFNYNTVGETYFKSTWEAYEASKNFNLYHTNLTKKSEKDNANFFKEESIERFFAMLNVDYSKDAGWKKEFADWLTGRSVGGSVVGSDSGSGGSSVLDPVDYAGIEFQPPIPYKSGQKIIITSGYGQRWGTLHTGIDLVGPGGSVTDILAVADGTVVRSDAKGTWGEVIQIEHANKIYSHYAHMAPGTRKFAVGDTVKRGDVVGKMGKTGATDAVHLHFNIYKGGLTKGHTYDPTTIVGLSPSNAVCNGTASNCVGKNGF